MLESVQEAVAQISAAFASIQVDDSSFPYLQALVVFIAVEYTWETYLDIRQRNCVATKQPPNEMKEEYTVEHLV